MRRFPLLPRKRSIRSSALYLSTIALVASACAPAPRPEPEPRQEPPPVVDASAAIVDSLEIELDQLRLEHRQLVQEYQKLDDRATKLDFAVAERNVRIAQLEQQVKVQQRKIDESISEVVRAKAKLRSVVSRAEAASRMAEAEIALNALADMAGGDSTEEYSKGVDYLERSAAEFEAGNYAGAIVLTSEAKSIIGSAESRLREREVIEPSAGEVAFGSPVPLEVIRNSNVRNGPGLEYSVLATLVSGTPVIGYSYKGQWVHVTLEDGSEGWIFQKLVSER